MGRHSQLAEYLTDHAPADDDDLEQSGPIEQRRQPAAPLWRSRMALSAVLIVVLVAGTWWLFRWLQEPEGTSVPQDVELSVAPDQTAAEPVTSTSQQPSDVIVHVAGAVAEPGIVELSDGARIVDALEAAGGPLDAADLSQLNLAAVVTDGEQILVLDEDAPASAPNAQGSTAAADDGATVNLNTADATLLQTLPGVGPALSERIIAHRESVGPFTSMADVDAVSGIGPAMMEKLEGLVSW